MRCEGAAPTHIEILWLFSVTAQQCKQFLHTLCTWRTFRANRFWQKWHLWGSNPRPFGMAPWATALDRSAKVSLWTTKGKDILLCAIPTIHNFSSQFAQTKPKKTCMPKKRIRVFMKGAASEDTRQLTSATKENKVSNFLPRRAHSIRVCFARVIHLGSPKTLHPEGNGQFPSLFFLLRSRFQTTYEIKEVMHAAGHMV